MLIGNKFMPELHLRQPGFSFSACGTFTKHGKSIQKSRQTDDLMHLY